MSASRTTLRPDARATVILLDGARPDAFDALARAGDLPNISRYVLEPGGRVDATTIFPSTTGVAYLPILTGRFPGPCRVPGIRWMDPTRYGGHWIRDSQHVRSYAVLQGGLFNDDVDPGVASLFDVEPDSSAICSPFTRGLAKGRHGCARARTLLGLQAHFTSRYEPLDRAVRRQLLAEASLRRRFTFAVLPGIDGIAHLHRTDHPRVLDLYRAFDRDFGRYMAATQSGPEHLVMLVSDHGFSDVHRHQDLALALERYGVATLRHPIVWRRNPVAAVMVSGNAAAHVYFAPQTRREERWSVSAIESGGVPGVPEAVIRYLADLHGVGFLAGTDGDDVVVISSKGRARITRSGDAIHYIPESADVLGYGSQPQSHDADGWLSISLNSPHPDGPVQLLQLFETERTGDLVVSASPGWDLRSKWELPEHKGGHGSLHAEHMSCLAAVNRPVHGPMRTVDVFPMVVEHLGYPVPTAIDGTNRLNPPAFPETRTPSVAGAA